MSGKTRIRCEASDAGLRIEANPILARGRTFGAASIVFAVLFFGVAAVIAFGHHHALDRQLAIRFCAFATLLGYIGLLAAFEKSVAVVTAGRAGIRRIPFPLPWSSHHGAILAVLAGEARSQTRSGGRYAMFPIAVRFADGRRVDVLDDAGDGATSARIAGQIAGTLGVGILTTDPDPPIAARELARTLLTIVSLIALGAGALIVFAGFWSFAIR